MQDERAILRDTVLDVIQSVAPEVDPGGIDPGRALRHQVDLDSMDWLNVLVALHERLGVQIPEADYARLSTLDQLVGYLSARIGRSA
jgi:acyl carrier protein